MVRRIASSGGARKPKRGRRVASGPKAVKGRRTVGHTAHSKVGSSQAKGFVDPRELTSEDLVTKTLQETSGSLGMAARPKVVDFSARLRERRMARIRGWAVRAGVALLVLAVLGGLIWTLFFSPVLRLESDRIEVHGGNEWVSGQRIKEIAAKQSGRSLLLVSTSEVTAQLGDIPGVSAAKADKRYPRGMSVTITAQKPAAMLKASDDDLTAVDDRGRILNSVKGASASGIPVIEVSNVNDGLRDRAVLAASKILGDLPEQMRHRISKVSARTQDSITTELDDGRYAVLWGDASDLALKQAVVDKIVNDPTKIGDKHQVDVSAPLRPIIK
ncbi:cell division protein FtsQ/DivIB [Bifidobacterium mongoliense]|uniref:cell division protein FtsQ/DivIB n=1 Tax=Bifidobacterium mongoliense TaxID=518643 RepID=UPI00264722FA|nr:FtsQ-type POTRA domain-containing protein [Bifidobacterium mongoliense]MDN5979444.1 cell division protein FtsQ/DivIB [Bifidobacterium mongoliense]MDN6025606.1 cell division protein FtsQ/DivIB [Bifidobacterium mongoliense]MDN6051595.1 cell division protein FtsQ/DivIB [Bifidobacterium mongoliense]MDN6484653.1 cell division protein FtsQ/DivIB [Bifidobacterium mongoliense]MDN6554315.1 cell division protein FtsQ/DivIB [Bifidobacterium mongoliense]